MGKTYDMETILQTMQELVVEGKIRHVGLSNETPWGVMSCLKTAQMFDVPRVVSVQNAYNLLNRTFETGLSEITHYEGVGLLAYSPLAQGYLTGKYQNGALPKGSRKQCSRVLSAMKRQGPIQPWTNISILRNVSSWTRRKWPCNLSRQGPL